MRYNETILGALRKACETIGKSEVARLTCMDIGQPGKILSGNSRIRGCTDDTWEKLYKVLVNYGGLDPNNWRYWPPSKSDQIEELRKLNIHPCDGSDRPPELRRACEEWDHLLPACREQIVWALRVALETMPERETPTKPAAKRKAC